MVLLRSRSGPVPTLEVEGPRWPAGAQGMSSGGFRSVTNV